MNIDKEVFFVDIYKTKNKMKNSMNIDYYIIWICHNDINLWTLLLFSVRFGSHQIT